jgi:hypothetical protein
MVVEIAIGDDRVMLTAYNPTTAVTLAKCMYALLRIQREMGEISEDDFREWFTTQPGGAGLLAKLDANELPSYPPISVDPRNARQEARIVAYLQQEVREQGACNKRRPTSADFKWTK